MKRLFIWEEVQVQMDEKSRWYHAWIGKESPLDWTIRYMAQFRKSSRRTTSQRGPLWVGLSCFVQWKTFSRIISSAWAFFKGIVTGPRKMPVFVVTKKTRCCKYTRNLRNHRRFATKISSRQQCSSRQSDVLRNSKDKWFYYGNCWIEKSFKMPRKI